MSYWWLPLFSALISAGLLALLLHLGWAGPVDQPNSRSLHEHPVPRGGGLYIFIGVAISLVWLPLSPALVSGLILLIIVSWWDDHCSLPVAIRFVSQFVAAGLALSGEGSLWSVTLTFIATVLIIVWITNLYNFMDGANGLAGGMAVFGFGAYGFAAAVNGEWELGILCACISAAAAGFLVFNFHPARIFMGDVGAIPLGYLVATLGVDGIAGKTWPLWFPILVFSPFVVDATATLLRHLLRGEKVWQPHREHYYQRLVRMGWSHRRLALAEYALMFAVATSALALLAAPLAWQWIGLAAWGGIYLALMCWIDQHWKRKHAV